MRKSYVIVNSMYWKALVIIFYTFAIHSSTNVIRCQLKHDFHHFLCKTFEMFNPCTKRYYDYYDLWPRMNVEVAQTLFDPVLQYYLNSGHICSREQKFFCPKGFCPGNNCMGEWMSVVINWWRNYCPPSSKIMGNFCPRELLSQRTFVPRYFCPRILLSRGTFVTGYFCPREILSQDTFVPGNLSQDTFVPENFCPRILLSQDTFVTGNFCLRELLS